MASVIDTAMSIYSEIKLIPRLAKAMKVGDSQVVPIPDAEDLSALLIKGPNNSRVRVTGIEITREG